MTVRYVPVAERKWGYRPSHHVFELVFLGVAVAVAIPLVVGAVPAPSSTASFLEPGLLVVWGWMLLLGSGTALVGLLWAGRLISGLVLEQVGLIILSGAVILYVYGAYDTGSSAVIVPVSLVGGFGLACAIRAWQLRQDMRDLVHITASGTRETGEQDVRDHFQVQDEKAERDAGGDAVA